MQKIIKISSAAMASFAALAFSKLLQPSTGLRLWAEKAHLPMCFESLQIKHTLQDEYTPSFSSFLGRGEDRSCAFFTAIRADPPAAPEPSVPPAPGAAGTEPAAPMAGDPCWITALSAIIGYEPRREPRPARFSFCRPLYSRSGISDMALILIFNFSV